MQIIRKEIVHSLKHQSRQLLTKMLSPLCGISQEIGYVSRTVSDKKMIVGSGALTGVHILSNREDPGKGAYHIGGAGFLPDESMIRILGETIERGAQLISDFSFAKEIKFAKHQEIAKCDSVLSEKYLHFYSDKQFYQTEFPFDPYSKELSLGWIKMQSVFDNVFTWIPAQLVLVGYNVNKINNEPWLTAAVTTGTAAHTNYLLAIRAALLELIQLDSVMGHWYTNSKAYKIEFDSRLTTLATLMHRYETTSHHQYQFYFLPNPDLPGFSIACVYLQKSGLPKVVIGLGADMHLEDAMYKAYLETIASIGLARMVVFKATFGIDKHSAELNENHIYDLDRNVEYYGLGLNFSRVGERFLEMPSIKASELPSDIAGNTQVQLQTLLNQFKNSNKQLYFLDLTNEEERSLGFKVVRVWSPQTLSLCLPSAPQTMHQRFNDYGGIKHNEPHPYP